MIRDFSVRGAIKRLSDITVVDLHSLKASDLKRIVSVLPVVLDQVKAEQTRRKGSIEEVSI
jgi:hypothetical protein